ncbi:hypothetical protein B0H16DRAFT_1897435 [Mycena metata]|uniref:Uncharacterized protein n=1 Tax=Mycena metata TaxID=1033252 RepID=A0AAD7HEG7_9AGAR|nr:hypothetical protein B0H16DRAFT_1897435 [Mycena metata]
MAPAQSKPSQPAIGQKFPGRRYKLDNGLEVELETLYLLEKHPLRPNGRKTYIYYQETTVQGLAATWEQEKQLETPMGSYRQILGLGYLELEDGDAVFSRSTTAKNNAFKDVIQIWVADGQLFTAQMKTELDAVRDSVLGPREARTRTRLKHTPATSNAPAGLTGGTAYERSPIAKSVKDPARAYTIELSIESPTRIESPVALATGVEATELETRKRLSKAVTAFAMETMRQGPQPTQDAIKKRSATILKPSMGSDDNWAYSTKQLNLASCKKAGNKSSKKAELTGDLGYFGGAHTDENDAEAYLSNMVCNHDIPATYEPGMFFLLQLGVFVRLSQYRSINFFGHRRHGGTPPLCPEGAQLVKWGYHWVAITYPPRTTVNGTSRVTLAALPNNGALIMPPEILHTGCQNRTDAGWSDPPSTKRSTFASAGGDMMEDVSLFRFTICWLILFMFYVLQQLPKRLKVQVDPDLIIQAITYDRDGERRNVGPWEYAPGHRRASPGQWDYHTGGGARTDQDAIRSKAWADWFTYQDHVVMHVPHLGRKGIVRPSLPRPRKVTKVMQNNSDADDEDSDESDISSNADSDDEAEAQKRKRKLERAKLRADAEQTKKAKVALARKALAAAKEEAGGGKRSNKRGNKVAPDPDDTETGVSDEEGPTVMPGASGERAARAAARAILREGQVSERALGKRKAVPLPDSDQSESAMDQASDHEATHRLKSKRVKGWTPAERSVSVALDTLGGVFKVLQLSPNAVETPALISGLWKQLSDMSTQEAEIALSRRLLRHQIMMTNCWVWSWLDGHCSQEIEAAVLNPSLADHWLHKLARDVKNIIEHRTVSKEFDPGNYGLPLGSVFKYHMPAPRFIEPGHLLAECILLGTKIIARWLSFPLDTLARFQAWFVQYICLSWSEEALLLDEVWDSYTHLRRDVLGATRGADVLNSLEEFGHELRLHPLSNPEAPERTVLKNISGLLQQTAMKHLHYHTVGHQGSTNDEDVEMPGVGSDCHQFAEGGPGLSNLGMEDPQPNAGSDRDRSTSGSDDEGAGTDTNYLTLATDHLQAEFLRFLTEAAEASSTSEPNAFQQQMNDRMDYIYPYREEAPSRQRVSGPEGQGYFQRVKQLATENYRHEHNGEDPPAEYFCLTNIYGPSNWRKVVTLAEDYAEVLKHESWADKFHGCEQIAFIECFDWLRGFLPERGANGRKKQSKTRRFKVLGPLASYLLTADLVYAGAVTAPTAKEMGDVIHTLNKGAVSGLQILRAIPQRTRLKKGWAKANKADVVKAFASVFADIERRLSPEVREKCTFSYIVFEHALCKFSRCLAKKWFRLYKK